MFKYKDSCRTYEILLQDSGLAPKPSEDWNTFVPQVGDIAHVDDEESDYGWDGEKWVRNELGENAWFDGTEWKTEE